MLINSLTGEFFQSFRFTQPYHLLITSIIVKLIIFAVCIFIIIIVFNAIESENHERQKTGSKNGKPKRSTYPVNPLKHLETIALKR